MSRNFWVEEGGSTTVDWVVLTASAGAMAVSMVVLLSEGEHGLGGRVQASLAGVELAGVASEPDSPAAPPPRADSPAAPAAPPVADADADPCRDCPIIALPRDAPDAHLSPPAVVHRSGLRAPPARPRPR